MASDLLHPLNRAVKREDAFEVRRLLDAGCDVHACDSRGVAPVLIAADRGNTNVLRLLLDAGADPNTPWPGGWTPLVRAAFAGSRGAVALLLDRGAEPWLQMEVDNRQSVAGLMRQFWPERIGIIELLVRAENADRSGQQNAV
jgi:ankyrin repeat protein